MTVTGERTRHRRPTARRVAAQFLWSLMVARVLLGLENGDLLSIEAWLTPRVWLYPLFFGVMGVYSYLYWMRHRDD
ncbi:hypothetical protein CWT12_11800 [Actinomyces sp. 432]|uniref:hypothetical protein n=3 Tax=unclassified Actinomyces TaxID=2609248 RepID=UPI0013742321|nr:hypothetical protein [Actinomyces sp. 432]NDR53331.1 hypothetical protein [Actinomyces sp. 565]QHO91851.1 hypothetical protein CWT12_11800 [Actinomyces sp. 432]